MVKKKRAIPKKVDEFLKKSGAQFELLGHKTVFTAFDKAATLKIKPAAVGKVLVVRLDRDLAVAVVPGDKNLDADKLKKIAKAKKIDFVKERVIKDKFKGIDPGAIPPFCGLWGVKVYADKKLLAQPKIILSSGSYEWSIQMSPAAFKKITPDLVTGNVSKARARKAKSKKKSAKPKNTAKVLTKKR